MVQLTPSRLHIVLTALLLWAAVGALSQPQVGADVGVRRLRVAELNCENLFDTLHTEGHADEEYLPQGTLHWDRERYHRKLDMLAREIALLGGLEPADVVALVEVEGEVALRDLTRRTLLREMRYRHLCTTGADPRGINVALLYREGSLRPLEVRELDWTERMGLRRPTRRTLHVSALMRSGDTLDLLVCHLPSKRGRLHANRMRRQICSGLRAYIDSLLAARPEAKIMLIGDMNTTPDARTLTHDLGAQLLHPSPDKPQALMVNAQCSMFNAQLFNISLLLSDPRGPSGSYRYRGHWEAIDQCIVSRGLLTARSGLRLARAPMRVVSHPALLEDDPRYGGQRPWRTFIGKGYHGGFSDHLPIIIDCEFP